MGTIEWGPELAEIYDTTYAATFSPEVLDPMVDLLEQLAEGGPALELAVGTGRVALPLSARGVPVHGIELSPHMTERLRAKPGSDAVGVTVGDMTSVRVPGDYRLVYVVANSIMNVTTQDEQIALFENAAAHLVRGGRLVVEVIVPQFTESARVFTMVPDHVGIETFDDALDQIAWSHHWMAGPDGRLVHHAAPYRYIWPAELTLMARQAGLHEEARHQDWQGTPFTKDSRSQVAIFQKPH